MTWVDSLRPLFDGGNDATRNAHIGLDDDRLHTRRAKKRRMLHMLHVANAAKHLDRLPDNGETFHGVMRGNYNGWDLVPAVLQLAAPVTIAELNVATLGFNKQNAHELIQLIDAGSIDRVTFICSCYYKSNEGEVYDWLAGELTKRGHRIASIRCHAKILCMELSDGRCIVNESSANLRSCRNIEQFTMTHDRDLLEFHRQWMAEVMPRVDDGPIASRGRPTAMG